MTKRVRTHANPLKRFEGLQPPDWKEIFQEPARRFTLEFGTSKGEFLMGYAAARPDCNILGTEIRLPLVVNLSAQIEAAGLTNAHVIYGNIVGRLRDFVPAGRVDEVFAFFPDPWPKGRHKKRRLITLDFLNEISPLMPDGALINIMTDHDDLRRSIEAVFQPHEVYRSVRNPDLPVLSGWQEYCERTGRPYWRLTYVKLN